MAGVSGTIRKVTLDGVSYEVMADTNLSATPTRYQNEAVPTTGTAVRKMTQRQQNVEGLVIAATGSDRDRLKGIADAISDIPMSYETAAGDVYRSTGFIEFESWESEENRASVTLIPRGEWRPFLAS